MEKEYIRKINARETKCNAKNQDELWNKENRAEYSELFPLLGIPAIYQCQGMLYPQLCIWDPSPCTLCIGEFRILLSSTEKSNKLSRIDCRF